MVERKGAAARKASGRKVAAGLVPIDRIVAALRSLGLAAVEGSETTRAAVKRALPELQMATAETEAAGAGDLARRFRALHRELAGRLAAADTREAPVRVSRSHSVEIMAQRGSLDALQLQAANEIISLFEVASQAGVAALDYTRERVDACAAGGPPGQSGDPLALVAVAAWLAKIEDPAELKLTVAVLRDGRRLRDVERDLHVAFGKGRELLCGALDRYVRLKGWRAERETRPGLVATAPPATVVGIAEVRDAESAESGDLKTRTAETAVIADAAD